MLNLNYKLKDFVPLIAIFSIISLITLVHQIYYGTNYHDGMRIFMAAFFIIFGAFKIINISGFAQAYSVYDLIANRFYIYGYIYPIIELSLGAAYLFKWHLFTTNIVTLVLMIVSAAGVFNELRKGKQITCACLGVVFKIPMTYVTLIEDILMATMALLMLL